jgi:hypothetical protein
MCDTVLTLSRYTANVLYYAQLSIRIVCVYAPSAPSDPTYARLPIGAVRLPLSASRYSRAVCFVFGSCPRPRAAFQHTTDDIAAMSTIPRGAQDDT